jgi:hypothetical protein
LACQEYGQRPHVRTSPAWSHFAARLVQPVSTDRWMRPLAETPLHQGSRSGDRARIGVVAGVSACETPPATAGTHSGYGPSSRWVMLGATRTQPYPIGHGRRIARKPVAVAVHVQRTSGHNGPRAYEEDGPEPWWECGKVCHRRWWSMPLTRPVHAHLRRPLTKHAFFEAGHAVIVSRQHEAFVGSTRRTPNRCRIKWPRRRPPIG